MKTSRILLWALLLPICHALPAQSWSQINTANDPGDVRDAAMAFDVVNGETVLFGGWPTLDATWLYDGADWTAATPATTPPGRREFAMAYDVARGVVVMFGGRGSSLLADTWEWNGADWTNVTPAAGNPPARQGHVMAYDIARGVTVLFGGTSNPIGPFELTDTWEWNGTAWTQVATASAPSESLDASMCYDLGRGVCVLTGGTSAFGAPDQSTWEYDGSSWVDRTGAVGLGPSSTPGLGVSLAEMVYDTSRGVCVLYGGRTPNGTFSTETWEYDGAGWSIVATGAPSSRTRYAMAFDLTRNQAVLYGGLTGSFQTWFDETWEFGAVVAAAYDPLGAGCPGTVGVASNTASSLPVLASTLVVDIGNLPAPEAIAIIVGFTPIPAGVDLTFLGLNGCDGYVTLDFLSIELGAAGSASWSLPLPMTPGLAGAQLFTQAVVFNAGVNAFGAVMSDAATATVGF